MSSFTGTTMEMVIGKTKKFRFTVTDKVSGAAVDISMWQKFWFTAKVNVTDADAAAVIAKTLSSGIVVVNSAQGLCEVTIAAADTAGLSDTATTLWAEIQGLDAAGLVWSLGQTRLKLQPHLVVASS